MGGLVQRILMFAWKGRTYGEALQGEYIVHVVRTSYTVPQNPLITMCLNLA